ncbi:3-hydroxyacyl-CoA dehydrogenase [Catenaria anguillulae PL171]|uniref:3-hydroxyacyl-CoA dehydrogenase n=1 Tax=Catenaria anguillulae PL171 TaxID=765915 RepID=A0A1Y2HH92_9FUNG|nr:3-hydroxyacyl-CoA dehydrogenase [Catenaria anguillulae PL171]
MLARTLTAVASRSFATSTTATSHNVQRVGVIGAGQMGTGIACVAAAVAKVPVTLMDTNEVQLGKGLKYIDAVLTKDVSKGKLTAEDKDAALGRVSTTKTLDSFANVDFSIEAVSENVDLKRKIFKQLAEVTAPDAILASNTSSISITKIAASTGSHARAQNVIGMHFMNPVPIMKLVEIIPGLATSPSTLATTLALSQAMGKVTTQSRDVPGFIANRLLMPYINEAVFALDTGLGTREDIDATMKLGTNMPMGPLTLADFVGLDTCLSILKILHTQLGEDKYRPCPLLQTYVDAGWVGKKVGRGFYEYDLGNVLKAAEKKK